MHPIPIPKGGLERASLLAVALNTLIVEDNAAFRKSLKLTLSSRFPDMHIHEACRPDEVLCAVERIMPELIFMDIQLPGGNGLELARQIRELCPAIHIVILTSYDLPEYREAAARCGASCFLSKGEAGPAEIERLILAMCPEASGQAVE